MSAPAASATRPARGSELELTVDRLAYGGNGVARREDGYVVFVAGAVPGDRVRAVVGKAKKAYAEARAVEVLEPSPDRVEPVADHPGAPWQVLPYERQLAVKQEQVDDAVERGRMTRDDATHLLAELVRRGTAPADRLLREVDRARRAAGLGSSVPITGYDDLTAAQVADRLDGLSTAQLRAVREHERRNANRKSVLQNIERKLD